MCQIQYNRNQLLDLRNQGVRAKKVKVYISKELLRPLSLSTLKMYSINWSDGTQIHWLFWNRLICWDMEMPGTVKNILQENGIQILVLIINTRIRNFYHKQKSMESHCKHNPQNITEKHIEPKTFIFPTVTKVSNRYKMLTKGVHNIINSINTSSLIKQWQ